VFVNVNHFSSNIWFLGFLIFRRLLVDGIVWLLMIKDVLMLGVCNGPLLISVLLLIIPSSAYENESLRCQDHFSSPIQVTLLGFVHCCM